MKKEVVVRHGLRMPASMWDEIREITERANASGDTARIIRPSTYADTMRAAIHYGLRTLKRKLDAETRKARHRAKEGEADV